MKKGRFCTLPDLPFAIMNVSYADTVVINIFIIYHSFYAKLGVSFKCSIIVPRLPW